MSIEKHKPIKSEAVYDAALTAIDDLMGVAPSTPGSDKLEVLVTLVEAYEARHWPRIWSGQICYAVSRVGVASQPQRWRLSASGGNPWS